MKTMGDGHFIFNPDLRMGNPLESHPVAKQVKRIVARCVRAYLRGNHEKAEKDEAKLRDLFGGMSLEALNVWALVWMIEHPKWCGATGRSGRVRKGQTAKPPNRQTAKPPNRQTAVDPTPAPSLIVRGEGR